jgi:hypothetical protein
VLKGNCFLGQLTAYGFFSLVTVGNALRQAYVPELLSQDLAGEVPFFVMLASHRSTAKCPGQSDLADALGDIYVRSYNEESCIGSAQGVMLGLYPADSGQSFVEVVDITSVDAGVYVSL